MLDLRVEEIQGLYGPFTISERTLQRIWFRGDFCHDGLKTVSGRSLEIIDSGRWNQNEGPDFKEARLKVDGALVVGDVEIHFSVDDWFAHGHDRNPNFNRVVLDVVLFDPKELPTNYHVAGHADPEVLVLMPLIDLDLEAYALEDALVESEGTDLPQWMENLLELPIGARVDLILRCAKDRWDQKVRFAKRRLEESGWSVTCHQLVLEVLGYARNREVMHRVASRYSIADFAEMASSEAVFIEQGKGWRLQGVRPANHPILRLEQYRRICFENAYWPEHLRLLFSDLMATDRGDVLEFRKAVDLTGLKATVASEVFADEIGESKLNTIMCDAVLPLLGAAGVDEAEAYWMNWYPGDTPERIVRLLKSAQVIGRASPKSVGLVQGVLQLCLCSALPQGWTITGVPTSTA